MIYVVLNEDLVCDPSPWPRATYVLEHWQNTAFTRVTHLIFMLCDWYKMNVRELTVLVEAIIVEKIH
jgi:hypothetical protein